MVMTIKNTGNCDYMFSNINIRYMDSDRKIIGSHGNRPILCGGWRSDVTISVGNTRTIGFPIPAGTSYVAYGYETDDLQYVMKVVE